jgi:hypothetical protein
VAAFDEATVGSSCFGDLVGIDGDDVDASFVDEKVELAAAVGDDLLQRKPVPGVARRLEPHQDRTRFFG